MGKEQKCHWEKGLFLLLMIVPLFSVLFNWAFSKCSQVIWKRDELEPWELKNAFLDLHFSQIEIYPRMESMDIDNTQLWFIFMFYEKIHLQYLGFQSVSFTPQPFFPTKIRDLFQNKLISICTCVKMLKFL